ncbi:hypothetical protein C8T65DRAFT_711848 [Cerioporus squamosus]|nr:hypothetical protein C8T65DRAFT_711848 [Cerioporus squamosus]
MALLVLRLGGRKLLHSMNKRIALPTIHTLRRARNIIKLMPSLGTPTSHEIIHNITQVFSPTSLLNLARSGVTVMMDEVSLEERSCYFPHVDCAGGFCREHSFSVNTRLSSFENTVNMARRLFEGKLHLGKEASIVAISSFGTAETPSGMASLLSTVFAAWKSTAAAHFGPIWSFASDGDAGRRTMVYQEFMKHRVDEGHELFRYLGSLPGLNLLTGPDNITADFDWKHELKRIGRMFHTLDGVMIGKTMCEKPGA